jgi:type IV pilus assembly protein PilF
VRARVAAAAWLAVALLAGCQTAPVDYESAAPPASSSSAQGRAQLYANLAAAYLREGQLDVALTKARQALAADAGSGEANNVMALVYQRLGEPERADQHFQRALRAQPGNAYFLNAYGSFLCGRGRFEEAQGHFDRAADNPLNRSPEVALTNAGICVYRHEEDAAKAEAYFRRALERNPKFAPALLWMIRMSLMAGEHLSARAYVQRYEGVAEHTPESLLMAVRAERSLGDRNAAARYQMMLKSRFPDAPEIQQLRESQEP